MDGLLAMLQERSMFPSVLSPTPRSPMAPSTFFAALEGEASEPLKQPELMP